MRGTLPSARRHEHHIGIIPAYAGNTCWLSTLSYGRRDHPRVCGEHSICQDPKGELTGSSPRMRGTPLRASTQPAPHGIIPAYAGNTLEMSILILSKWDHPRVCGEHGWISPVGKYVSGSSPRMRGTRIVFDWTVYDPGIIPAYAGNTQGSG